jgi:hypothetical protein
MYFPSSRQQCLLLLELLRQLLELLHQLRKPQDL